MRNSQHGFVCGFLLVSSFFVCEALSAVAEESIPSQFIGEFKNTHQVRDMDIDCSGQESDLCGLEDVVDKVSISHGRSGRVNIQIKIVGISYHSCTAEGEGFWSGGAVVMQLEPSDEWDEGTCVVRIKASPDDTLQLSSEPYKSCSRYCGARAFLETNGLRKITGQ